MHNIDRKSSLSVGGHKTVELIHGHGGRKIVSFGLSALPLPNLTNPMAFMHVLVLISIVLFANEVKGQKNQPGIVSLGSSVSPNDGNASWSSTSGHFAFGFYPQDDGFAIGIWLVGEPKTTIVWTANRDGPSISSKSTLELTTDGRLLLRIGPGNELLIANSSKPATSASMLDSGNFVLYGESSEAIWQSFDSPTDTILGGQNLSVGVELISSKSESDHSRGHFKLVMQGDGNLVSYPLTSAMDPEDSYFSTGTFTSDFERLILDFEGSLGLWGYNQSDSHLVANSNITILRSMPKNTTTIYRATLDSDGIFRLYAHSFLGNNNPSVLTVWSALSNPCDVKGYCGFNSYCENAICQCYPGFVASKHGDMFLGCQPNRTKDDCENSADPMAIYDVHRLEDVIMSSDSPYSMIMMKIEACAKACQEDCDCGAGLYINGSCGKYQLPLRYGQKVKSASTTAFFKVPSGKIIAPSSTFPNETIPKVTGHKRSPILILVSTLGPISFICLVFAIFVFFIYRRQVYSYKRLPAGLAFATECTLRSFSFDELLKSTGGFTEEIGRGPFGAVYRGTIGNRTIVVKRLEKIVEEGEREFRTEITTIARTHHRNLVQLLGFCIEGSRRLLVYEYVSNGSLADLLFKAETPLSWRERVRIALDVARGVRYLHEECEVCIIHCNIKPQNILMDEAWTAKISEFGLARLLMPNHSRIATGLEETSGYLPPEWQKDAPLSVKTDIYSYGIVLLEVICRRSSIDLNVSSTDEIILSSWVYDCFVNRELNKLASGEDVEWKSLERMVKVGLWCVQEDPNLRPSMKHVTLMLEGLEDIAIPPSPALVV